MNIILTQQHFRVGLRPDGFYMDGEGPSSDFGDKLLFNHLGQCGLAFYSAGQAGRLALWSKDEGTPIFLDYHPDEDCHDNFPGRLND